MSLALRCGLGLCLFIQESLPLCRDQFHYIARVDLELMALMCHSPECWNCISVLLRNPLASSGLCVWSPGPPNTPCCLFPSSWKVGLPRCDLFVAGLVFCVFCLVSFDRCVGYRASAPFDIQNSSISLKYSVSLLSQHLTSPVPCDL